MTTEKNILAIHMCGNCNAHVAPEAEICHHCNASLILPERMAKHAKLKGLNFEGRPSNCLVHPASC